MKTNDNQNNIKVTIVCTGHGWVVVNNATSQVVFPKYIRSGRALVNACNRHRLAVTNAESLIPALRDALDLDAAGQPTHKA